MKQNVEDIEIYFVKIYILWHKCPLILKVAIKFNNIEGNESKDLRDTPLSQDTYTNFCWLHSKSTWNKIINDPSTRLKKKLVTEFIKTWYLLIHWSVDKQEIAICKQFKLQTQPISLGVVPKVALLNPYTIRPLETNHLA